MVMLKDMFKTLLKDRMGLAGVIILLFFVVIAVLAPAITTHDPNAIQRVDGKIARLLPPSTDFLLGTTDMGRDVFSQVVMGSRIALIIGIIAALLVTIVGTNVGIWAGYYGGWVDNTLMRIVDVIYGIPFIPFVIILVSLLQPSTMNIIIAISILTWRTTARVVRSQVLSLAQRPYIKAAKVAGAGDFRIMYRHILPNVLPIAFVEMSFTIGWAIVSEASVSFVGLGDPQVMSWGKILHAAFISGAVRFAPWWVASPGVAIVLLVMSVFFIQRSLEVFVNPRLKGR